jgi:hypothetical protein
MRLIISLFAITVVFNLLFCLVQVTEGLVSLKVSFKDSSCEDFDVQTFFPNSCASDDNSKSVLLLFRPPSLVDHLSIQQISFSIAHKNLEDFK